MWSRGSGVLWRAAPGYLVVARTDGPVVEFGGPAADVWLILDQPRAVGEIVEVLASRYDADADVIAADVEGFLGRLAESAFVHRVEPAA